MTMYYDLRLANGEALLPGVGPCDVDILIADGRIAGLCQPGAAADAAEVVDVGGLTVLPGAIDSHAHVGHAMDIDRPREAADVTVETRAAAAGGVSCFIPYVMSPEPYSRVFTPVRDVMEAGSLIDFGMHFVVATEAHLDEVDTYVGEYGVSTMKVFTSIRGDEGKHLGIPGTDDGYIFRLLESLAAAGGMFCPHSENIELIRALRARLEGQVEPALKLWYDSRPPLVEADMVRRMSYVAGLLGVPFYAVHTTCAAALEVALAQRWQTPRMHIETCPHYLTHDFTSDLGPVAKINPPLRSPEDREALWEAIAAGAIDVVASDHCGRPRACKDGDIWAASPGFPGIETLLPVLISEGHAKRGIPLDRLTPLVSRNPARIHGLYPRKGDIAIGFDADFSILDLKEGDIVEAAALHSRAGYSIYEGWKLHCRVVHTTVRGAFVKRDGEVRDMAGHGRYYPRPLAE